MREAAAAVEKPLRHIGALYTHTESLAKYHMGREFSSRTEGWKRGRQPLGEALREQQ